MKIAYVAGPYRSKTEYGVKQNIDRAEVVALELWRMGFAVICPHKNTAFFGGAADDSVWLAGDLEMVRRCDLVVTVDGFERSTGAMGEVELAKSLGIPVMTLEEAKK